MGDLLIVCDAPGCIRGVVRTGEWGGACGFCHGRGSVSLATLAERIGENEGTLRKILRPHRTMRGSVTLRVMGKLLEILEGPVMEWRPE